MAVQTCAGRLGAAAFSPSPAGGGRHPWPGKASSTVALAWAAPVLEAARWSGVNSGSASAFIRFPVPWISAHPFGLSLSKPGRFPCTQVAWELEILNEKGL